MIVDGGIRDTQRIYEMDDFNAFIRGVDPSAINNVSMPEINGVTRIGEATCIPGDVVLGTRSGVIFIPPHLAEEVVISSEDVRLKDEFGQQRIMEGIYTPGEVDRDYSDDMIKDFENFRKKQKRDFDELKKNLEKVDVLTKRLVFIIASKSKKQQITQPNQDLYYKAAAKYFSEKRKGDLISRMTSDVTEVEGSIMNSLGVVVRDPVNIIASIVLLMTMSAKLTGIVLFLFPIAGLVIGKIGKSLRRKSNKGQIQMARILSAIEENISGLRIIKAFNAQNQINTKFEE